MTVGAVWGITSPSPARGRLPMGSFNHGPPGRCVRDGASGDNTDFGAGQAEPFLRGEPGRGPHRADEFDFGIHPNLQYRVSKLAVGAVGGLAAEPRRSANTASGSATSVRWTGSG